MSFNWIPQFVRRRVVLRRRIASRGHVGGLAGDGGYCWWE